VVDYASLARFYDAVMGDPLPKSSRVVDAITRHSEGASSVLELGCGTGSVLAGLPASLSVTGLDRSPEMLAIARSKVPKARFIEADISSFDLGERFDVIICVGLHTGEAELRDGDYFGTTVNRAARLVAVAHGGQVICSSSTAELLETDVVLLDLGEQPGPRGPSAHANIRSEGGCRTVPAAQWR
jgi:class 3 adenylate cyclase